MTDDVTVAGAQARGREHMATKKPERD
jgi:hypothetical protein